MINVATPTLICQTAYTYVTCSHWSGPVTKIKVKATWPITEICGWPYRTNCINTKLKHFIIYTHIKCYMYNTSVLQGVQNKSPHKLTYISSLAITVAMRPVTPLWDTTVPSTWGIAPFLMLQVHRIFCCSLTEVRLHWHSVSAQTRHISRHDAMPTPCSLFRKH